MTREEAVKFAEHAVNMTDIPAVKEFYRMAAAALTPPTQEQVERMRGEWIKPHWKNSTSCAVCSHCGFEAHHYEYHGVQDNYQFCPHCMSPMTDEAVGMVMERLRGINSGRE